MHGSRQRISTRKWKGHENDIRKDIRTIGRASLKAKNKNETRRFVRAEDNVTTDNGIRLKQIHKATWVAPDGVTMSQIDNIAIDRRHMNNKRSEDWIRSFSGQV